MGYLGCPRWEEAYNQWPAERNMHNQAPEYYRPWSTQIGSLVTLDHHMAKSISTSFWIVGLYIYTVSMTATDQFKLVKNVIGLLY